MPTIEDLLDAERTAEAAVVAAKAEEDAATIARDAAKKALDDAEAVRLTKLDARQTAEHARAGAETASCASHKEGVLYRSKKDGSISYVKDGKRHWEIPVDADSEAIGA
jgi:hypothetical protein